ncbi:beta-1,4-xylosyltransferase IRX9-like [Syzygium oleosum]|uniref:beta-1,4-xylosyltransferase IRX9-like n=1 Tax=Syzygium oleosum TaxID=219896 RepID=UPI0011D2435D|nr:beta-1,4-xylosyltransferase IRX9-like [Syzygium oleosum]
MGSAERSKKKVQLWKKAIVHFSLCFVMGFFTGFAPTGKATTFAGRPLMSNKVVSSPQPAELLDPTLTTSSHVNSNRSLISEATERASEKTHAEPEEEDLLENEGSQLEEAEFPEGNNKLVPRRLLIIVTPTTSGSRNHPFTGVLLRRLANTIKLVPQPLLWIIVEKRSDSDEVSEIMRKTGIMYRHLVFRENFTDPDAEMDHQRNVALRHIEHHKLSGIVHFAGLSNVYDLDFFQELREIEVFGTWPMAVLSANRKKVSIEGPVCDSSQVLGWHLRKMSNETPATSESSARPPIHISSFAFNSSILWDPERWGRPSSGQPNSQDSMKFVKEVVHEDETKVKGLPGEKCSKIMLWHLRYPPARHRHHHPSTVPSEADSQR